MNDFILCSTLEFKISDYEKALKGDVEEGKALIANAITTRLLERYILPCEVKQNKNGFNVMASCCLLIESIQGFYGGHNKTPKGDKTFEDFFSREKHFELIHKHKLGHEIYSHIRCGILHQGETTGGWRIRRDLYKIIDIQNKIIDANYFRDAMKKAVIDYGGKLKSSDLSDDIWLKCKSKVECLIKNCK